MTVQPRRKRSRIWPCSGATGICQSRCYGIGMRKELSVSDLRERFKLFKILVVVNGALLGLSAVELLWTWSSRPDLARRDILILNALFGLGFAMNILWLRRIQMATQRLHGIN